MEISLYLDLQQEYLANAWKDFKLTDCVAKIVNQRAPIVIISDNPDASDKWEDYAVIGVEHMGRMDGIAYVTDSLANIDREFVELVYCRKFNLPVTIKETKRLIIREMCLEDVAKVCSLYEDNENVRFLPPVKSYDEELELAKAYIKNMYGVYGYGLWVVIFKDNGDIIGRVGIEHRDIDGEVCHEMGYMIAGKYQGCGLGYEAAGAVLEYAREYGIEEMIAYINEKNTPSVNLATKLGACKIKTINDGAEKFLLFRF